VKRQDTRGLLHRHPVLENDLCLPDFHVIVDRADWEKARQAIETMEETIDGNLGLLPFFSPELGEEFQTEEAASERKSWTGFF